MNIEEESVWKPKVYQAEYATPVQGGSPIYNGSYVVSGFANAGFQDLADRSVYLKDVLDTQETDINSLIDSTNTDSTTLDEHIGSGADAHRLSSIVSNGFVRASQKVKMDNIGPTAQTGNYYDLYYKPNTNYFIKNSDFTANVQTKYYCTQVMTVALPQAASDLDWIVLNKLPAIKVYVQSSGGVVTPNGVSTDVLYDVEEEITLVFSGGHWNV